MFVVQIALNSAMVAAFMLAPGLFAGMFTSDPTIIGIVVRMLPVFCCGMGVFGIQNVVQCSFVGMGQAKPSLFLAIFRKIILLVPLALILPHVAGLGVLGVFVAESISDITSAIVAGLLFRGLIPALLSE